MTEINVLIIDDEVPLREAIAANLARDGYNLFFAENGEEGLNALRETLPTVVILDLKMPVMDGHAFLQIADLKPTDPYSIIVLTGHGDDEAVQECYQAGVTFFLQKPFSVYQLRGLVKSAIDLRQLTNELHEMVGRRTAELEQRLTEITALNRFYQDQSNGLLELIDHCEHALKHRDQILREISVLANGTEPFPFAELREYPKADSSGA